MRNSDNNASKGNLGYLYYREYYKVEKDKNSIVVSVNTDVDNKLIKYQYKENNFKHLSKINRDNMNTFILKTTYPGLIIGSGYMHSIKNDDEFKLGFYFDYTTGLPIIPGSSVKGMIRSVFRKALYNENDFNEIGEHLKEVKSEMQKYFQQVFKLINKKLVDSNNKDKKVKAIIKENDIILLSSNSSDNEANIENSITLEELSMEMFEGKMMGDSKKYINVPVYKRDIFFDANVNIKKNNDKVILADDYITPHKNPLEEPKPLKFLKIAPDVNIEFQFSLKDDTKGIVTSKVKEELFKRIIKDFGIGAKTTVGYGYLEE
ncbi:type III-B CRISPR module RAMP protein Cmr6 [Clostridium sediminicola]|uniref:type III-B CRISPR module RAMP protein Cmr6 n=1 Tax=Clostridium sediminicola TaxID=3114879 RepID=UPI0031F20B62